MIPDGWRDVNLADITSLIRNGFSCNQDKNGLGYPVTRIETISDGTINYERVGFTNAPIDNSYRLKSGDILFSHINSVKHIGKVAIYDDTYPLYHGMNLMLIRCQKSCVNPLYLYYILSDRRAKAYFENHCKQAINQASLNRRDIGQFQFTLSPLPEQKKIAAILSSVDDAIQATQAVIDQTYKVKQGLLQQLLARGIGHTRFKQTEIGEIPEKWEISTISSHLIEYKSGAPLKPSDFTENGCKVIPKKAVVRGGKIRINKEEQTYAKKDFTKQYENSIVDYSYLITTLRDLVPSGPNIGLIVKINDNEDEYLLAQGVYGFKLKDSLYEEFLIQLSNSSEYRKIMNEIMVGSTQVHIRNADFFNLKIPLPSLEEQQNIATILSEIDTQIECNKNYIFNIQEIKKGLMQDLLTGRVRVKPDEVNTT
jgi:type I restriction enzyme S subunit